MVEYRASILKNKQKKLYLNWTAFKFINTTKNSVSLVRGTIIENLPVILWILRVCTQTGWALLFSSSAHM